MFWIDTTTAVSAPDTPSAVLNASEAYFTNGNPGGTPLATQLSADWYNMMQGELLAILSFAGVTPSKTNYTQVLSAIQAIIAGNLAGLGTASTKAATNNAKPYLGSPVGSFTPGHTLVANDALGSYSDSGVTPYAGPSVTTVPGGTLTPGAVPGQIYRTSSNVAVTLDPTALTAGWTAWFEVPLSPGTGYFELSPAGSYTLDGVSPRFVWPGARVGILWNGTEFETYAGEYFYGAYPISSWSFSSVIGPINHYLGCTQVHVELIITCLSAEAGYSVGDEVIVGSYYDSGYARGYSAVKLANNSLYIVIPANGIMVFNYSTQVATQITPSKWSLTFLVRAK